VGRFFFVNIFDFKLLKGNPQTALKDQFSVVLSETAVKKYFAKSDPMGQTLLITGDALPARVTGVMKDIPENSQIKAGAEPLEAILLIVGDCQAAKTIHTNTRQWRWWAL
jgi:MacB-like periplasmic core domain